MESHNIVTSGNHACYNILGRHLEDEETQRPERNASRVFLEALASKLSPTSDVILGLSLSTCGKRICRLVRGFLYITGIRRTSAYYMTLINDYVSIQWHHTITHAYHILAVVWFNWTMDFVTWMRYSIRQKTTGCDYLSMSKSKLNLVS